MLALKFLGHLVLHLELYASQQVTLTIYCASFKCIHLTDLLSPLTISYVQLDQLCIKLYFDNVFVINDSTVTRLKSL